MAYGQGLVVKGAGKSGTPDTTEVVTVQGIGAGGGVPVIFTPASANIQILTTSVSIASGWPAYSGGAINDIIPAPGGGLSIYILSLSYMSDILISGAAAFVNAQALWHSGPGAGPVIHMSDYSPGNLVDRHYFHFPLKLPAGQELRAQSITSVGAISTICQASYYIA